MEESKCIFCKIAIGEIPSKTIYEDVDFRVILDISPATRGHALILPKEHYKDLFEIPEELLKKAFSLAKKIGTKMSEKLCCDGFNIVQNNGVTAGQTVFHFHIHLIPRYADDQQMIGWSPSSPDAEELNKIYSILVED